MSTKTLNSVLSVPWEAAKPYLARALQGYDPSEEVEKGNAFSFLIGHSGAVVLIRAEHDEMVIVAFEGVHQLKNASYVLLNLARAIKARSIRVHTKRRGELRYLNGLGLPFEQIEQQGDEQVLRMVL